MKGMTQNSLSIGDVIRIQIDRLAFGGEGVGRVEGLVVFVPLAAPGDVLDVQIVETKKNFARGSIVHIIRPSADRRQPPCQYYGDCGGCQLQHLSYEAQLRAKSDFIRDSMRKIGGIEWPHEIEVKRSPELSYRSRAQLKLDREEAAAGALESRQPGPSEQHDRVLIGFHRRSSHSVCDIEECVVLEPELNSALAELRTTLNSPGARRVELPRAIDLAAGDSRVAAHPPAAGIAADPIKRRIGRFIYQFSASTFFQANPSVLADLIDSATLEAKGETAVDLYAGVGLFTLPLATAFKRVIGVESSAESAAFAAANIGASGLSNIVFRRRRSEDWLREHADAIAAGRQVATDFMLVDPPRGGVEGAGRHLIRAAPVEICYVSCNPATLSRDLARLIKHGYRIEKLLGLDLFPQTYHVETIARLRL